MTIKLQTGADLQKRITAFGKTVATTQQEAHNIAVQVLMHYDKHGDYTLLARFVGGKIGKKPAGGTKVIITDDFPGVCGTLRKNIVAWFTAFSDLRFNGDGRLYIMNRNSDSFRTFLPTIGGLSETGRACNVAKGIENPWYTLDGAARDASRTLDLLSMLTTVEAISKKLAKALEADAQREPGEALTAYDPAQLDLMKAFSASLTKTADDFVKAKRINVADLEEARKARKAAAANDDTANVVVDRAAGAEVAAG